MARRVLYPGWALCPSDYYDLEQLLGPFESCDRGYFGPQKSVSISPADLVIAHSWGCHRIDHQLLTSTTHVILLAPFLSLLPKSMAARVKKQQALQTVRAQLGRDPKATLSLFYERCGLGLQRDRLNIDRLIEDHAIAERSLLATEWLRKSRVTIIHGADDAVIPLREGRDVHAHLPGSRLIVLEGGGHFFPLTHAAQVDARENS